MHHLLKVLLCVILSQGERTQIPSRSQDVSEVMAHTWGGGVLGEFTPLGRNVDREKLALFAYRDASEGWPSCLILRAPRSLVLLPGVTTLIKLRGSERECLLFI